MPPLPVIADTFRVALNWTSGSHAPNSVNVMHFRKTAATATDIFGDLDANVSENMWACIPDDYAVQTVDITPLDGVSATETFSTGAAPKWTGGATGQPVPQVAGIVKLTTLLRGRSFRGRVYLGPCGEDAIRDGLMEAVFQSAGQIAWGLFINAMSVALDPMVVASYKLAVATVVNDATYEFALGTQRRRQTRLR